MSSFGLHEGGEVKRDAQIDGGRTAALANMDLASDTVDDVTSLTHTYTYTHMLTYDSMNVMSYMYVLLCFCEFEV